MAKPSRKNCTRQRRGRNKKLGVKDTPANTVLKVTYQGEDFEKIKREFQ